MAEANHDRPEGIVLSICTINTENWEYINPCLRSIYESGCRYPFEVIVVDNASRDGSPERISQTYPEVVLIENKKRSGFSTNNNLAIRRSTGKYVMLLNDDTLVKSYALNRLVEFLEQHPTIGSATS